MLLMLIGASLITAGCFFTTADGAVVTISPGEDVQSVVNSHPEGTAFIFESGTYFGQSVEPKSGQKFVGVPGTVFNGNGQGSAFVSNLRAFNVLIEGIEFTNYNPGDYRAVLDASSQYWDESSWRPATNWRINHVRVHNNGGGGDSAAVEVGSGSIVSNSRIENNAGLGIFGNANGVVIENSTISNNGFGVYDVLHHSGGMKLVMTHNAIVRNNTITGNNGPGVWFDISADNATIANNSISDNTYAGIQYEISRGANITGNTLDNNGWGDSRGWLHATSIYISTSWNVNITGNTVSNAPGGVTVLDQRTLRNSQGGENSMPGFGRLYDGEWRGDNVNVSGNTFNNSGRTGASAGNWESYGTNIYNTARFSGNTFSGSTEYWWGSGNNFANAVGAGGFAGFGQS